MVEAKENVRVAEHMVEAEETRVQKVEEWLHGGVAGDG